MKKYLIILLCAALIIALAAIIFRPKSFAAGNIAQIESFVTSYGWQTDGAPPSAEKLTLPQYPGDVFDEYNRIQKEAGLDLTPYYGREVTKYSFVITNHPEAQGREVFANILVCDGKVIAADIMVTSIDGFMHAINKKHA